MKVLVSLIVCRLWFEGGKRAHEGESVEYFYICKDAKGRYVFAFVMGARSR